MNIFNHSRWLMSIVLVMMATSFWAQTNVGGTISVDSTFTVEQSPYIVTDNLTISNGVTLTIENGVTVKVNDGRNITVLGVLDADGATITSNSSSPAAGKWSALTVGNDTHSANIRLNNCVVEYANKIRLAKGEATITASTLQNFSYYGVELTSGVDLTLSSTTITGTNYPLYFQAPANVTVNSSNTFSNNTNNFAYLNFQTLSSDWTLAALAVPYMPNYNFTINNGVTLTTTPGTSMAFKSGKSFYVYGSLVGNGTTFTSSSSSPSFGSWDYLHVGDKNNAYSGSLNLTDCIVEYLRNIHVDKGSVTLANSVLKDFLYHGIYTERKTTVDINGGSISTTSTTAKDGAYYAMFVNDSTEVNLNGLSMNGFHYGLYLNNSSSKATLDACTLSELGTPVYFKEAAGFIVNTANTFSDNDYNHAWIAFASLSRDWELPKLTIPYDFNRGFDIQSGATFTVTSGNIFKIRDGYAFDVHGVLNAIAKPDENIFFTAYTDDNWGGDSNGDAANTSADRYSWTGIRFYNAEASASEMNGCNVRFTGDSYYYNTYGGVTCYNSSPTIDSCEFSNNKYGLTLHGYSSPKVTNTTFASSSQTPIAMSFEADPVFENNTLSFSDNAYDAIGLLGGTLTADAIIRKRNFTDIDNITYYMLDNITVPDGKTLTIDPGVVIKSTSGRKFTIDGTIMANGTAEEHIVFTSASDDNFGNPGDTNKNGTQSVPGKGNIGGFVFNNSASDTSQVSYCDFRYSNDFAIYTEDASPSIINNSIIESNNGVKFYGASAPVFKNNVLVNISNVPVIVSSAADPSFDGNSFTNVGLSALGLKGGDVTQSGTLKKKDLAGYENITYVLMSTMTIKDGAYVDIEPGVVLKMGDNYHNSIYVEGGFKVVGTEEEKVIITSYKDDNYGNPKDVNGDGNATSPGADNWGSIRFLSSSDDDYCRIENTEIKYGGGYYSSNNYNAGIFIENASPNLKDALIFSTGGYGVNILGNSAPILDGVTIQNSSWDPVGMSLTSDPQFSNMTFLANRSQGLAINDNNLAAHGVLAQRDVAGIENIAYILNENLTIASNSTLTINPGVVVKPKGTIYVRGALVAEGTKDQKITFTAIADDSRGGDTDNNGNNATPNAGNWYGLYFYGSALDSLNSLKNVELRYGREALRFENCKANVDSCVLEQLSSYPVSIYGAASPLVSNTEMMNCRGLYLPGIGEAEFRNNNLLNISESVVKTCTFSKAKFENNTMANVDIQAIELLSETYSQTDTIPFRSFAGYDSITYYLADNRFTINNGTEITIPAGMVFKGNHSSTNVFTVNGKINVAGTSDNPVIFTDVEDDGCGKPLDTKRNGKARIYWNSNSWFVFNNVSDDESVINYAQIKHMGGNAIKLYSASPNINNCFFDYCYRGIYCNGVSEPKLRNNTFHNLSNVPFSISLVAYPSVTEGNVISGSTYKMIEVNNETLTQDLNLPQRSFAGIDNVPYYFTNYTVGSGAVLNIDPGVICKFDNGLYVNKGLMAQGGSTPDSMIIFTSYKDDTYGGDSNSDGESYDYWYGIDFSKTSIDADCQLENCVFANVNEAIYTNSANPTISNSLFYNVNEYAIRSEGASKPSVDSCDFVRVGYVSDQDNSFYSNSKAVYNVHETFEIDATNCWWGSTTGPRHDDNPDGTGHVTSDAVNYTPFATMVNNPQLGDVSRNGYVQAFDASLVLLSTVGDTVLDKKQRNVANVSGNTGENAVSAYDASLILQKVVGAISYFGEASVESKSSSVANISLSDVNAREDVEVVISVDLSGLSNVFALQAQFKFDSEVLSFAGVEKTDFSANALLVNNQEGDAINVSLASTAALANSGTFINLKFIVKAVVSGKTEVVATQLIINEIAMDVTERSATVYFDGPTLIEEEKVAVDHLSLNVYPNPFDRALSIDYVLKNAGRVNIEVYSVYGQLIDVIESKDMPAGKYTAQWEDAEVSQGMYIIRISTASQSQSVMVQKH